MKPTLRHVIPVSYTYDRSKDTYVHNQGIVQVNPESKLLITAQLDRVHFGQLLNKCSVPKIPKQQNGNEIYQI